MNHTFISFSIFLLLCYNTKASDGFPLTEAFEATVQALSVSTKAPPEKNYKKNFQIQYTTDSNKVKSCTFIKKVSLSNDEFIDLPKKNCDEMIQRMSHDETYTKKHILFFEYIPSECTIRNLIGQLFKCD